MKSARIFAAAAVVLGAVAAYFRFGLDAAPEASPDAPVKVHVEMASAAQFARPVGVALDEAGNLYVADSQANVIYKINSSGVLKRLAGNARKSGLADGMGAAAAFNAPQALDLDAAGNLYVADSGNNAIRRITPEGAVSTPWGPGKGSALSQPAGVAVGDAGDIYVADTGSHTLREMTAAAMIKTVAGSGQPGHEDGHDGESFSSPGAVAVDGGGNLYVADSDNHTIRKITRGGMVTTLAGAAGQAGHADGTGGEARFSHPAGVAVDRAGNVYVADTGNQVIRKIAPDGAVTTLAGSAGQAGRADGAGTAAGFNEPRGITLDRAGNLYVADSGNRLIRTVTPNGAVTTVAGAAAKAQSASSRPPAPRT